MTKQPTISLNRIPSKRQSQSVSPTHLATTLPTNKVKGHLRVCSNGKFRIFPLLQMRSQDTNLKLTYETRFEQEFKTKLNKL